MKKLLASSGWLLLLLPLLTFAGAKTAAGSTGLSDSQERKVGSFNAISSSGSYDITITMGKQESIRLEGDKDDLDQVETVVENNELKIRNKKRSGFRWSSSRIKVFITARNLKALSVSGSGNTRVSGTVKSGKFDTRLSGSGNLEFSVETASLTVMLSGSGRVNTAGSAKDANIAISGSGDFKGEKLRTENADIRISGSGNASIVANASLNAAVSGSGNVYYGGSPKVNSRTSGSGNIRHL